MTAATKSSYDECAAEVQRLGLRGADEFRAWCKGFTFTEVPILFTERDSGDSKMSKKIVREAVWRVWWLKFQQIFRRL